MADFISASRSNYVHVTSEEAWKEWISRLNGIEDFSHEDEDGRIVHGCGCYGSPWYSEVFEEYYDEDADFDDMYDEDGDIGCDASVKRIQEFLPEDEAFIYLDAGWEKLRYVQGSAMVVTKTEVRWLSLMDIAKATAQDMLGNLEWDTQLTY